MAQVVEQFYSRYRQQYRLSPEQASACQSIKHCQTESLGGYQQYCRDCGYTQIHYCSCGNRHCPLCKQQATQNWLDKQQTNLLAVPYYHTVFTLPHEFNGWARLHPEVICQLMFQAVWQTLKAFSHQHKRRQEQLGATCVLHTWGQNLSQHIHLHCLIPAVTLSDNQHKVCLLKGEYLYPVKALQRKYRGKFVSLVRQAYQAGELCRINNDQEVNRLLNQVMQKTWVIYIKTYLKNPEMILQYLSRYTYKIAISNQRIISVDKQTVKFRYQDYRDGQHKVMCLDGVEFLRRFLQHVLPKGFMWVRHYGYLANAVRKKRLALIRQLLFEYQGIDLPCKPQKVLDKTIDERVCPKCHGLHLNKRYLKKVKRRQ